MSAGSRLRYLAGTSKATLAVLPLLVAFGYSVLPGIARWRGDFWWGYNHLIQALPIAVVLIAFVAGWDAGTTSSGLCALRDRAVAGWRIHATLLAPPLAAAVVPYVAGLSLVAISTVTSHGVIPFSAVPVVLTHLSMLLLAASVGVLAGWFAAAPYAAAGSAAVMAGLLFWTPPGAHTLFAFPGTGGPAVDGRPDLGMYGVAPWGLVLAAVALALPVVCSLPRRGVVVTGVLGAVAALWASSALVSPNTYVVAQARPTRCLTQTVTVCMFAGYDRLLRPALDGLDGFLGRAEEAGVPRALFPARYEQGGNVRTGRAVGEIYVDETVVDAGAFAPDAIAQSVSSPDWCPEMFGERPPLPLLERVGLVYDWVLWLEGEMSRAAFVERHPGQQGGTPAQVAEPVRTALAEIRTCTNT